MTRVLAAPGNAGIAAIAECFPDVAADDVDAIVNLVDQQDVDLTVVGSGGAARGRSRRRAAQAASQRLRAVAAAARIEGSKAFAKEVMARRGVPTARAGAFEDVEKAVAFVDELGGTRGDQGRRACRRQGRDGRDATARTPSPRSRRASLEGAFGDGRLDDRRRGAARRARGARLRGDRRHRRVRAARRRRRTTSASATATPGPNTGGMGAYSPVPAVDQALATQILDTVHRAGRRRTAPVSRRPVRGDDAHRRRAEGARVQLPVR